MRVQRRGEERVKVIEREVRELQAEYAKPLDGQFEPARSATVKRLPPPMYRVRITAHDVPPRWRIETQTVKLPAPSADFACDRAVKWVHSDARLPPLRRFVRHSLEFTTATPVGEASVTTIGAEDRQRAARAIRSAGGMSTEVEQLDAMLTAIELAVRHAQEYEHENGLTNSRTRKPPAGCCGLRRWRSENDGARTECSDHCLPQSGSSG